MTKEWRCPTCATRKESEGRPICCGQLMDWAPTAAPGIVFKGKGWTPKGNA